MNICAYSRFIRLAMLFQIQNIRGNINLERAAALVPVSNRVFVFEIYLETNQENIQFLVPAR